MKRLSISLAVVPALLLTAAAFAADPDGFAMFKAADIKSRAAATKLDEVKAGLDRAGSWGNHGLLLVRREADGLVEVHQTQVDIIIVVSGEGTLVVGGTLKDGKSTGPNEIRGKMLTGAERHPMAVGDVFHVPANVPHQMLVPKSLVTEVIKVDSK